MAVAFARFHLFRNEAKGFRRPFLGEDTHRKHYYFGFFHTSGIGAEGKRKSRALCVCEEESFESYGFLLKRKVLFEKFAMDNAQKVESEWICRKGSLEFQQ
ncbi:hypothetical protein TNCT_276581 [Trichonephila clavata]|uniref:Uncharacterized protein n=1 Tax=Trichonephila clavata TaxID=2740835 RepID=A0A8X6IEX7_TRICU|nr:hypothetical protein TNCT_276581 [Trichonephila clavata]